MLTLSLALVLVFCVLCPNTAAQTQNTFTPDTVFAVPNQNGTIKFALNGSYTSVVLQDDKWVFTDLKLNDSQTLGTLTVSAKNSKVTIDAFYSSQTFNAFGRIALVRYHAEGKGEQTFNLGLNLTRSTHQSEWSVIVPGGPNGGGSTFLAEGREWHLFSDNTVAVEGLEGTISISYFGYRYSLAGDSNQPLIVQHSVAVATAAILAVTVATASLIAFRNRRKP